MKKRLMMGLLAGALTAAMLPGVAWADAPEVDGGALFEASISCTAEGIGFVSLSTFVAQPAGAQGQMQQGFQAFLDSLGATCVPGTKSIVINKID